MALFKIFRGAETVLSTVPAHEGYAYFCEDTGNMFIDTSNNISGRVQLNAHAASVLRKINSSDPTQATDIDIDDVFLKNMVASIEQGGTGAKTAEQARTNLNVAKKGKCLSVELVVSNWTGAGPFTQSVNVVGVLPTSLVIPSPDPDSLEAASSARVYCSNQGANTLTFTCKKKPTVALIYNIFIQEV